MELVLSLLLLFVLIIGLVLAEIKRRNQTILRNYRMEKTWDAVDRRSIQMLDRRGRRY